MVEEKYVALMCPGANNSKLHGNLDNLGISVRDTYSIKEYVVVCYKLVKPGDTVLFGSYCVSFDLFESTEDRDD